MANYDLQYEGPAIDSILDTGKKLEDDGYIFLGLAAANTTSGTPDKRVFYFAGPGSYSGFSVTIPTGAVGIFAYNGSAWVTSVINTGSIYDVSSANSGRTYASLSTAIEDIPSTARKAGMEIKFVNTSTSKYEVWIYQGTSTSAVDFTNTANWIGVDETPLSGSNNLVSSGGVYEAIQNAFDKLDMIDSTGTSVQSIQISVTLRRNDGTEEDPDWQTVASLVLPSATTTKAGLMSADDKAKITNTDGVFDISEYTASGGTLTQYASLSAALGTNGINVPQNIRNGGMSVKFVQSSDNKYVQYRLMSDDWSTVVTDWQGVDDEPTAGSDNLVKSSGVYNCTPQLKPTTDDFFSIEDDSGSKVLQIGNAEAVIGDICILRGGQNGQFFRLVGGKWTAVDLSINTLINTTPITGDVLYFDGTDWTTMPALVSEDSLNSFSIEDETKTKALYIDKEKFIAGLFEFNFRNLSKFGKLTYDGSKFIIGNGAWGGKKYAAYGDSVTAISNGNYEQPYTINQNSNWCDFVADYYGMSKYYGRGIGGQMFRWDTGGGSVSWVTPQGNLINRLDDYNYDSWNALETKVYPTGVTAQMIADGDAITIRGCGCSWLRIVSMFPSTIKDSIDVITLMFHNDASGTLPYGTCEWIANNNTDTEWSLSSYYSNYGGDYNISTTKGAIASLVMKLQAWMPNAIIVLCTPMSGRGNTGALNKDLTDERMQDLRQAVIDMGILMSIPVIDVYATDGINGLNRTKYISDSIHPYLLDGKKMLARAIIGGLNNIIPNI